MTPAILSSLNAHWNALTAARGVEVQYSTGQISATVMTLVSDTVLEGDGTGVLETYESRVFITRPELLPDGMPKRFDIISEGEYTYQVNHALGGRHWEFTGEHRTIVRIFTVAIPAP